MADSVLNVKLNAIMDISDVKHNVDQLQNSFKHLKLPDKLGDSLKKNIESFNKEYDKYQKKVSEGIHTQGDNNAVNKSLNSMLNSYEKIINEFSKLSKQDFKDIFNLDTGAFEKVQTQIKQLQANLDKIKLDPSKISKPLEEIKRLSSAKGLTKEGGILDRLMGSFKTNDFNQAKQAFTELEKYYTRYSAKMSENKRSGLLVQLESIRSELNRVESEGGDARTAMQGLENILNGLGLQGKKELDGITDSLNNSKRSAESLTEELKRQHNQEFSFNQEVKNIDRQIQSYFGLSQIIRKVGNIARDAFSTVKELDAAMVETAVVTNFDVGDMWNMLPMYTKNANQLGSTIKDVYEAATLYYQQGLNQSQAMGLASETLKMARIGGLEAAEATDMMTAALRGFNMQINELSAQRINDVYSELAAITASNTKEIGSAMERTASIANSANMEFETTSAFLAQMIETTREAPENLGTAMKTIIARFQEMKQDPTKLIDSEGVMMDANRVDKALKTIGVDLMNQKGEFRDLDDVFLDIAAKWDSLTQGQQRYIATIAAGSRQQSRFIAMMSNYDRTMELVEAANNSAGASQRQFEKTLEGMDAKLNKLKNAWNQFAMGLMNNQIIKFGVDALTKALDVINKIINTLGGHLPDPFGGLVKSVLTLVATFSGLNLAKKGVNGLVGGIVGWAKNDTGKGIVGSVTQSFKDTHKAAAEAGKRDGQTYSRAITLGLRKTPISQSLRYAFNAESRNANALINTMIPPHSLSAEARKDAILFTKEFARQLKQGQIDEKNAYGAYISGMESRGVDTSKFTPDMMAKLKDVDVVTGKFEKMTGAVGRAGNAMQTFGAITAGTPLAPFGAIVSTIGTALIGLGTTLNAVRINFLTTLAEVAVEKGVVLSENVALAVSEETVTFAMLKEAGAAKFLGAALWESLGPYVLIAAAIAGIVIAVKALDAAIVTDKERLEAASNAAGAASDAYSSAKQETSELADNINRIKEADAGFDGLVAGTAEFNEKLVEANQLILDLINKYPMLNDYLTIDKNGRMQISEEGFKAVTDYQKQRQAYAAALNVQKNAELEAEKTRQKIQDLTYTTSTIHEHGEDFQVANRKALTEEEEKQLEIYEKQYESQKQSAALNSARTIISGKELNNQEAVANLYASQYETLKKQVTLGSKKENYEKYAEFYGYSYEGGKLLDVEGNEVNVDYDEIKDAIPDITVMMNLEANAESIDKAIASINESFEDGLNGDFEGSSTFISDILANNAEANEDLVQAILKDDSQVVKTVQQMSAENIATLLNVDKQTVENNLETYQNQLIELIHSNATNIAETQAQEYADLAAMIGEAQYSADSKNRKIVAPGSTVVKDLEKQLETLTARQRRSILNAGKGLQEAAGRDSMKIIVGGMTDLYNQVQDGVSGAEAAAEELQATINGVNWNSAIERMGAYRAMADSNTESIREMGQALLESSESSNLMTEAFEEMFDSQDFQKLLEDADNLGDFTSSDILEMSKQSQSLKKFMDETGMSVGGTTRLINALTDTGVIGMGDLNDSVLTLIDHFSQLDNVLASAHQTVSEFDEGVDTGEGEDFIKERYEKINELVENGEYGNEQLLKNVEFIFGADNWKTILEKNDNNIQKALNSVESDIELFKDGYKDAWARLAKNDKLDPENLVEFDENGGIKLNINGKSTDEIVDYLVKNLKGTSGSTYSRENMELALAAYVNNSPDARYELEGGNFISGFKDTDYLESRRNIQNQLTITQTELQTIAGLMGKSPEEIKSMIGEVAGINKDEINVLDNIDNNTGLASENYKELADEYSKYFVSTDASGNDWVKEYKKAGKENTIDLTNAFSDIQAKGLTEEQAYGIAYQAFKDNDTGATFEYEGRTLNPEEIKTQQDFIDALQEFEEESEWTQIGEAVSEGFVGYLEGTGYFNNGNNPPNPSNPSNSSSSGATSTNQSSNATPTQTGAVYPNQPSSQPAWGTSSKAEREALKITGGKRVTGGTGVGEGEEHKQRAEEIDALKDLTKETRIVTAQNKLTWSKKDPNAIHGHVSEDTRQTDRYLLENADEKKAEEEAKKHAAAVEAGSQKGIEVGYKDAGDASQTKAEKAGRDYAEKVAESYKAGVYGFHDDTNPKVSGGKGQGETSYKDSYGLHEGATSTSSSAITGGQGAGEVKVDVNTDKLNEAKQKFQQFFGILDKESKKERTVEVKTNDIDQSKVDKFNQFVESQHPGLKFLGIDKATEEAQTAVSNINNMSASMPVELSGIGDLFTKIASIRATISKPVTIPVNAQKAATGVNNKISYTHVPMAGSLAKGTKKGKVGPRNQGGLTLTGEEGYEIGWIPSESRSFILGANGPQMVNLPKEAVVYNHDQSKDIIKKRKTIDAGSSWKGAASAWGQSGWSGTSSTKKALESQSSSHSSSTNTKTETKDEKLPQINNFNIQEIIRFDLEQKINNYQAQIDKLSDKINKQIEKVGAKASDISDLIKDQSGYLNSILSYNNQLVSSYKTQLKQLDKGNYKTVVSYTNSSGDSKQEQVNLSDFIYQENGVYQIDTDLIKNSFKSNALREAVFKAAEGVLNPLVSGLSSAQKAALEAQKQLEELGNQAADMFYNWKNEMTRVYSLSQKMAVYGSEIERFNNQVDLELARAGAGMGGSYKNITAALSRKSQTLKKNISAGTENISATRTEMKNAFSSTDEAVRLANLEKKLKKDPNDATLKSAVKTAKDNLKIANLAAELTKVDWMKDGGAEFTFDYKALDKMYQKGDISKSDYDKIKESVDNMEEKTVAYNNAINEQTQNLAELYEQMQQYKQTIVDFESTLLNQLQANLKRQIDNSKKLNSSLTNTFKSLLDSVKKKLDQRRQAEDNAKTEDDIAKKQQRLAYLRANTSGGNQVEIAQLEKEIGEAQQSYQRTLEDQMLTNLQEQGDQAAQQREQQIAIAEAGVELQREANAREVNKWLNDPDKYRSQIESVWLQSRGIEEAGLREQEMMRNEFNSSFLELKTALTETETATAINKEINKVGSEVVTIKDLLNKKDTKQAVNTVTKKNTTPGKKTADDIKKEQKAAKAKGQTVHDASYYHEKGISLNQALKSSKSEGRTLTYQELRKGGYTIQDFIKAGIKDKKKLLEAGFSEAVIDKALKTNKTSKTSKTSKTTSSKPKAKTYSGSLPTKLPSKGYYGQGDGYGSPNSNVKLIQTFLKKAGFYNDKVDGSFGPNTTKAVKAFQTAAKKQGVYSSSIDGWFGPGTLAAAKKYKSTKFKKGGLASFTGPAWLDGTKSKPELVLNSTDTKNFIQLKDVLSSVMRSGAFEDEPIAVGDTNIEVNINVDHIANDYDVDKIANRVKKIIVKDSNYRNVTAVRKFR